MSLRFRKSLNLGHGFRINFNKKSVGVSGGIKGFRYSVNSDGTRTRSVGVPGTGLYDVKTSKKSKSAHISPSDSLPPDNNKQNNDKSVLNRILDNIPGFRTRSAWHMILAGAYYILTLLLATVSSDYFIANVVLFWSMPFCICAIIDTVKYKKPYKLLTLPVCLIILILSVLSINTPITPTAIQLNVREISFDDVNENKVITYNVTPSNADKSKVKLISSNTNIADFTDDTLHSKAKGETTVYAVSESNNIKSNEVHVIVKDKKADAERAAQEAERLKAEEEARIRAEQEKAEQQQREAEEKAKQETQQTSQKNNASVSNQPKNSATSDSTNSQTVYIGNTGDKYHRKSCSTLKGGGHAISLSEAKSQGRQACKRCKP